MSEPRPRGRPEATSRGAIEQAAFALFAARGFDGTTLDQIAEAVGVTRRTLFRYYASKNDIAWGDFDLALEAFDEALESQDPRAPLASALAAAIVEFNRFPTDARPAHADRMRLILTTPTLQAHSALRYEAWREKVAQFVRRRRSLGPDDLLPGLLARVALAAALASYDHWLAGDDTGPDRLQAILSESFSLLARELGD